jgi:hypothetical protein
MAPYAADTNVSVDRTRTEIERTLVRYGATAFAYGWNGDRQVIQFAAHDRQIRFELPLPARSERRFTHTPTGKARHGDDAAKHWEQGCRQRWRALLLIIKAKLEAIESGVSTFEDEWLSWTVMPDNLTVGQHALPAVAQAYETGEVAPLLALGPAED